MSQRAIERANLAQACFDDCTGWDTIKDFCHSDATFSCQSGALADVKTVQGYADWTVGLAQACPGATWELHHSSHDPKTSTVVFYATYTLKHTVKTDTSPPVTGKEAKSEYAYFIKLDGDDKITGVRKLWNDGVALQQLGWA